MTTVSDDIDHRGSNRSALLARRPLPLTREERRARGRQRTRAWRDQNARLGRPETAEVGKALIVAVVTTRKDDLDTDTVRIVDRAFELLIAAGYRRESIENVFRAARRNFSTVTCALPR